MTTVTTKGNAMTPPSGLDRRALLKGATATAAGVALGAAVLPQAATATGPLNFAGSGHRRHITQDIGDTFDSRHSQSTRAAESMGIRLRSRPAISVTTPTLLLRVLALKRRTFRAAHDIRASVDKINWPLT